MNSPLFEIVCDSGLSFQSQSAAQRFKVTSKLRCLGNSPSPSEMASEERRSLRLQERVHLCDIMQEEDNEEQGSAE